MIVRVVDAEAAPGGTALMLCDDDGAPLPMQVACSLVQQIGDATITVTFRVDGDAVRLA